MKLHYSKILLFSLPLNILVTSSYAHNKNKPYITPHARTTTSRVLSECDIETSIYDNDPDMKYVKENFDRQTSQRFEEYQERMKEKRQKCKEQRDKNVQEIIEKDRKDKSLSEKLEKGCLRCGCGLGGVAASVGLFGGFGIYGWKSAALAAAEKEGALAGEAVAEAAGAAAGKKFVIAELQKWGISTLDNKGLVSYFATTDYTNFKTIAHAINTQYDPSSCILPIGGSGPSETFCALVNQKSVAALEVQRMTQGGAVSTYEVIETAVKSIVTDAKTVAETAVKKATEEAIKASTDAVESAYAACQTAIIASVVAIIIIALVMIIIYLILRYRRKKKMNKKQQYTKLLNQ
ncbi:hypothetical protein PFDG_00657 [Plasmodium falciparum Dd2]|uniref:Rifin n=1 Tax=Plasmodium falciparum (isolate Dd2) TaxID=57267 RepID=A0A0L7LXA6_PLAF4|nr:hypothetical protein PFDG_00657 [Plasmodium falciparum Dd2]